ncbi:MAG: exo-alpha-sialidase, partial [Methylococcales bacterium]
MVYPIYPKTSLGLLDVAGFDVTVDQQALHVLVAGTHNDGDKKLQLRYLHSEDGGKHWSNPVIIDMQLPVAATNKAGNDVQLAVSGQHLMALWQSSGELPGMGPLASAYSQDGGKTWHAGANPAADMNGDQSHSDLAVDAQGVFHAVWLADPEENGYQSLRYARSNDVGQHWQAAQRLDDSTCSCCWNTLKITPAGELNILYRDMQPRDMALLQSHNHGETWQQAGLVGKFNWQFDGCPHIGGGLAVSQTDGNTALDSVVWTGEEHQQGLYHLHSADNGKTWAKPYKLGEHPMHSDIAVNAAGVATAVWDEREPDGAGIFTAQTMDAGLSWSKPKRLSQAGNSATHPRVVATATGFMVMWTEKQAKQLSQWAFTMLE